MINIQDVSCWETGQGRPGCNHKPQTTNLLSVMNAQLLLFTAKEASDGPTRQYAHFYVRIKTI